MKCRIQVSTILITIRRKVRLWTLPTMKTCMKMREHTISMTKAITAVADSPLQSMQATTTTSFRQTNEFFQEFVIVTDR